MRFKLSTTRTITIESYSELRNRLENFLDYKSSKYINELTSFFSQVTFFYYKKQNNGAIMNYKYIGQVRDCIVIGGSKLVISHNNYFLHDENYFLSDVFDANMKDNLNRLKKNKYFISFNSRGYPRHFEIGINLMSRYNSNYFHFIVETIPKILLLKKYLKNTDIPFIFEKDLHENIIELINALNNESRPIAFLERGELYTFDKIIQVSDQSLVIDNYYGSDSMKLTTIDINSLKDFVRLVSPKYINKASDKSNLLYIKRKSNYRNLLNQEEIESCLMDSNFLSIYADDLTINQQVNYFNKADMIITPTGAHLTNIIWMRPKTKIYVLISSHPAHQLNMWKQLAKVSGVNIFFIKGSCSIINLLSKYGLHADYTVSKDLIKLNNLA